MLHIVLDLNNRTYSVCDGVPNVERNSKLKADNLNRVFSREKKNYERNGVLVLRVPAKNKIFKIDSLSIEKRK
jgi:hypothetical protein